MLDLKLTVDELKKAIFHLFEAKNLLEKCKESLISGSLMAKTVEDDLRDAWYEVNCCRVYTEPSVRLEGFTLSAMGRINDALCMMDSLIQWKKGLTKHGRLSILNACSDALSGIDMATAELEYILSAQIDSAKPEEALRSPP